MTTLRDVILADLPANGSFWELSETSGNFADSGGGGHAGTPVGTPLPHYREVGMVDGSYGVGFSNAAGNLIDMGSIADFEATGTASFSFELSILFSALPTGGNSWWPIKLYDGVVNGGWRLLAQDTRKFSFWRTDTGGLGDSCTSTDLTMVLGVWCHMIATYDGTNMRLYQNGVLIGGPTASSRSIAPAGNPFRIGAYSNGAGGIEGRVAYPAYYPGLALSSDQVTNHWNVHYANRGQESLPVLPDTPQWEGA